MATFWGNSRFHSIGFLYHSCSMSSTIKRQELAVGPLATLGGCREVVSDDECDMICVC